MSFCRSIVNQARANGLVSINVFNDGDKRIGSSMELKFDVLSPLDDDDDDVSVRVCTGE